jgi:acetylornithine deacetylase/succinyl-diaminopimelate desuccinylase-like protein
MDTVPDTGWQDDPWSGRTDGDQTLHGLGSTDMKGPLAAAILAARALPETVPVSLLITTDEETTKAGARRIVQHSALARAAKPKLILVVEPTGMTPVRGHRSHIAFTCVATGVQAHSSTGRGVNANWALIPFLVEMKAIYERLRTDPTLQDRDYDPVFSDFNVVLDNHGAVVNVTVPKATARIKFRYSARLDPTPVLTAVHDAAARAGITVTEAREGAPPELPADHPFVRLCAETVGAAHRALRHRRVRAAGTGAVRGAWSRRYRAGPHAHRAGAPAGAGRGHSGVHAPGRTPGAVSAGQSGGPGKVKALPRLASLHPITGRPTRAAATSHPH